MTSGLCFQLDLLSVHRISPFFGLSKERLILGHHAKAHILKSGGFHVKSTQNLIKSDVSTKTSVWGVQGGGYDPGFHEILGHSPSPAFIKLNSFG